MEERGGEEEEREERGENPNPHGDAREGRRRRPSLFVVASEIGFANEVMSSIIGHIFILRGFGFGT